MNQLKILQSSFTTSNSTEEIRYCLACLCTDGQSNFVELLEPLTEGVVSDSLDLLTCFNFCTQLKVTFSPRTRFRYLCQLCKNELLAAHQFITKAILSSKHMEALEQEANAAAEFANFQEDVKEIDLIEALEEKFVYVEEEKTAFPSSTSIRTDVELEKNLVAIFGTDDFETEFLTSEADEQISVASVKDKENCNANVFTVEEQVELINAAHDEKDESEFEEEKVNPTRVLVKSEHSEDEEGVEQRNFDFKCELCLSMYSLQRDLLQHYDKDHDDKDLLFPCDICASHFANKNALRIHKRQVHDNCEYLDCEHCGQTVLKSFLHKHLRRHKWKLQYLCSKCPNTFTSKNILHKHMAARHVEDRVRDIACADCDRKFFTVTSLQVHRVVHEKQPRQLHTCTLCSKTFVRQANLKLHMQMHRGQTMDCNHCGKQFVRRKDLEIHVRFHTGEFPYGCSICDRRFAIKSHLTSHEQKHAGIRYSCSFCDKIFVNHSGLKQHSYEHTGKMPFSCSICSRGFPTRFKVRRHLRSVHQNLFAGDEDGYTDALADQNITTTKVEKLQMKREYIENVTVEDDDDSMEMEMLEEHINSDLP